jgi:hypothetical protein
MNFVEKLLANGFNRIVYEWEKKKGRQDAGFNPQSGWMGLTIYHPYERFEKGNKSVELDLSRFGVYDILPNLDRVPVNEKVIRIKVDGQTVYENRYGVLPPLEIQNLIL